MSARVSADICCCCDAIWRPRKGEPCSAPPSHVCQCLFRDI